MASFPQAKLKHEREAAAAAARIEALESELALTQTASAEQPRVFGLGF